MLVLDRETHREETEEEKEPYGSVGGRIEGVPAPRPPETSAPTAPTPKRGALRGRGGGGFRVQRGQVDGCGNEQASRQ